MSLVLRRITVVAIVAAAAAPTLAVAGPPATQSATDATEAPQAPTWRFRQSDRRVKVVVLAGSIGAFGGPSYARQIGQLCRNVEVKNLSKTGLGAWALKRRYRDQVLDNRRIRLRADDEEHWLVFGGGLNSVATPERNNRHVRELMTMAHRKGVKVVALTLTPWGSESDRRRWAGVAGLKYRKATQKVVDFTMRRLTPREALGVYAGKRRLGADAPWDAIELPDVAVDLYDSRLRTSTAPARDLEQMRQALREDSTWQRAHRNLDTAERDRRLESDARVASEIPRWYLRPELRSFDHIHLNAQGHALVAEIACPALPASWGCDCPTTAQ